MDNSLLLPNRDNYIWTPENPDFNYFTDIPANLRKERFIEEFIDIGIKHPHWAARYLFWNCMSENPIDHFKLADFQAVILDMLWNVPFPMLIASRGAGKTFMLAVYSLLKALLCQSGGFGEKIVIVGAAFRQSKLVFNAIIDLVKKSPLLMECGPTWTYAIDKCELIIGNSTIIAIPMGNGNKIRGYRATVVIADEYAQIPEEIFNVVVKGFNVVTQNPVYNAERIERIENMIREGIEEARSLLDDDSKNQTVIASTAYYQFNHLYDKYRRYLDIINNKVNGKASEYSELFGDVENKNIVNHKNFAVIQIPYTELPKGFLQQDQINESKLTMSRDLFNMEYMAEFITDTDGFFKRSLIQSCTPAYQNTGDGCRVLSPDAFTVELEHDGTSTYVMGIDPARARGGDNFAIAICKIQGEKTKLVYLQTFRGKSFTVLAKTIYDLVDRFKIIAIGIDKGGGGETLSDILAEPKFAGSRSLLLVKDDEETEYVIGKRIIELINYSGDWLRNANFDIRSDMEQRRFLFPFYVDEEKYITEDDSATDFSDEDIYDDSAMSVTGKVWQEIVEAKDEMCSIVATPTGRSGQIHFDLPSIKSGISMVDRKDRYSAIIIAADQARNIIRTGLFGDYVEKDPPLAGRWLYPI